MPCYDNHKKSNMMLNKRLQLVALLLLGIGLGGLQAQSVYVNENNGTQTGYALKKVKSMRFDSGTLKVAVLGEGIDDYAFNGLRNLTFTEETVGIDEYNKSSENLISLYPNPVSQTLHIDLPNTANGYISIFNTQGQLLQSQKIGNQSSLKLDVQHLPKGVYFCRYDNLEKTQTIKFVKE